MIKFECEILVPTATLIWTLPNDEILEFGVLKNIGEERSSPNNDYIATLTGKMEDSDPETDRFFFTSTLLVKEPINGTTLTCTGGGGADPVEESTEITLSGENNALDGIGWHR